jgi:hypothetical protein
MLRTPARDVRDVHLVGPGMIAMIITYTNLCPSGNPSHGVCRRRCFEYLGALAVCIPIHSGVVGTTRASVDSTAPNPHIGERVNEPSIAGSFYCLERASRHQATLGEDRYFRFP